MVYALQRGLAPFLSECRPVSSVGGILAAFAFQFRYAARPRVRIRKPGLNWSELRGTPQWSLVALTSQWFRCVPNCEATFSGEMDGTKR